MGLTSKARDPRLSPPPIDRKVMAPKREAVDGWSDKGLGACTRTAKIRAIHQADAAYPKRDERWHKCVNELFGREFARLTQPGGRFG
jgi:hypothetical protein